MNSAEDTVDPKRLILFSIDHIPKELQKHVFAWFDLKNLKCNDILDFSLILQIILNTREKFG